MTVPIKFKVKPYNWQLACIERTMDLDEFAIFAEQGTGKTCALVNIYRLKCKARNRLLKALILAPLVTLNNWKDEFAIHSHIRSNEILVLKGSTKQKIKTLMEGTNNLKHNKILVTNYESMINKEFLQALLDYQIEFLALDEAHYVKSHNSKRSKNIHMIAQRAKHKFLLTGTPILNQVDDLFMPFLIMDNGKTFGKNYYVFRSKYMMDANAGWAHRHNHFPKYVNRPDKMEELNEKVYSRAVRVLKKDCLDLPPYIEQTITVPMSPEQSKAYREMQRDFCTFIDEQSDKPVAVVAQLAITKGLRLQQIVTGHVTDEEGNIHEFKKNPRLDQVRELLEQITPDHKVILWCSFKHNYKQLSKVCEELGIGHRFLTGEQSLDQKTESMKDFKEDDDVRVIIANRRAGGIGVNLVSASYSIVYSRNFSLGEELQSQARNYRGGSQVHERIVKIDLCAENTVDELITKALQSKQDISDQVIDLIKGEK